VVLFDACMVTDVNAELLMKKADGRGRVAVNEIMVSTAAVASIIREGATQKLYDVIIGGKAQGMQFMDESIWDKLRNGLVSPMEAYMKAIDKARFKGFLPPEDQALANAGGGESKK
jgi:twitching motility protein PilT